MYARQILISPFSISLTHLEDYKETHLSSNNVFRSFPQEMVKVISDGLMFTQKFQETMSLSTDSHEMIHQLEPVIQKHGLDFFKGAEMMINPTTFFSGIQKNIEEYYRVPRTELEISRFQANIQEKIVQFSEIFSYGNPVSSVVSSSPITDGRSDHKPLLPVSALVANNLDLTIHDAEHMEDMMDAMKKKEEIIDFFIETLFSEQKLPSGIKSEAKNHIKPKVLNQAKLGPSPEILFRTNDVHEPFDTYTHSNTSMLTDVSSTPLRPVVTITPVESQRPRATRPVATSIPFATSRPVTSPKPVVTPRPLETQRSGAASRPVVTPRPATTQDPEATPRLLATLRSSAILGPVVNPGTVNTQRTVNSPRSEETFRPEVTLRLAAVPGAGETAPRLASTPRPEGTLSSRPVEIPRSSETSSGADNNKHTSIINGLKSDKISFRHGHFPVEAVKPVVISIHGLNIPHHNYVAKIEKTPIEYDHNNILDNFLDDLVLQDSISEVFGDIVQVEDQNGAILEKASDTEYDSTTISSFDMMLTSFLNSLLPTFDNDDPQINSEAMLKTVKTDLMHTMADLGSENLNHLVVLQNYEVTDAKINDMIMNGILEVTDSKVEVTKELFVSMFSRNNSGSDFLNSKLITANESNLHGNKFIFLPIQNPSKNSHVESNLLTPSEQVIKVPAELDNKPFVQPSGVVKSRQNYDVILLNPISIDQSPDQDHTTNLPVFTSPELTSDLSVESFGLVTKSSVLGTDKTATINNNKKNQFNFKLRKGLGKFHDGFKTKKKFGFANSSKGTDSDLKDIKNLLESSLNDIPILVGSNQNKNIIIKTSSPTTVSYVFTTPDTISDATSLSTDATSLSTDDTSLSTDATSLSTDATSLSTDATSLPTDATSLPTDATSLPTDATSLPTDATSLPTDATSLPLEIFYMLTSFPSDVTLNPVDITNDLTATTYIFDETTFFPEDIYDVFEDIYDVSEDVTHSLDNEAEDTLYATDNETDLNYTLIPSTEDATLSAESESFEDKFSVQQYLPCNNNASNCKSQEETEHSSSLSIESDLEQLLTTSSRDPESSESSVISGESSSEKLLNMSKQLLKQLTMATLGDSKLEQLPDLLEQIFQQLGLNAASTTEVASTSTSTSTRAYRAKNFKHRVLSSYYDKNGGIEEESVEEVEEDLKMGLLASLRSQIITNALEDRNIIAKAANVMRYFPGRRISSKSLRNYYKTGGSVESSGTSADLEKELQDKLAAELNATLREQLQSLKQRVEEEYSEKAGYERDVVDSVRKQLEIFTSALRNQSGSKSANMNSNIDDSETDLTKALEAQLRSFYANLL